MAMTLVSTVTVGSGGAASIQFTNIPQTGKDLLVLVSGRTNTNSSTGSIVMDLNGNTTNANYPMKAMTGTGSSILNDGSAQRTPIEIAGNTSTANTFGNGLAYISNYTSTTNKSISVDSVGENNATSARQTILAASFTTSSAITSITLNGAGDTIAQHSTASLYIIS